MRKVAPNRGRARSLLKMSNKILERINLTEKDSFPSQVVRDYFDIIHQLFEALASFEGVKFDGTGSHEHLIDWGCGRLKMTSGEKDLLQGLRKLRNRFAYEGFFIKDDYLSRNESRFIKVIKKIRSAVEDLDK